MLTLEDCFFDIRDAKLIRNLEVSGSDIVNEAFEDKSVSDLGRGVNLKGTNSKFDVGVAFGTPGKGKDQITNTSFTLSTSDSTPLTLDQIALVEFGARLTSVDPDDDGLKLTAIAPATPDANDDAIATD